MTDSKADADGASDAAFQPFADDDTAVTIGGLTIENGTNRIAVSGSLDIEVDKVGLKQARNLLNTVQAIVAALVDRDELPERAQPDTAKPSKRARNPFA